MKSTQYPCRPEGKLRVEKLVRMTKLDQVFHKMRRLFDSSASTGQ